MKKNVANARRKAVRPPQSVVWDCAVLEYGDVLDGWRIDAFLSKGGFGAVYHAVACDDPRQVAAVKIFSGDIDDDANHGRERIHTEKMLIEKMGSTYAPALYGFGEKDGRPYIIMEYLDAIDPDAGGLPEGDAEIREFFLQLLESVGQLHAMGWLHCDIKPANIARRHEDGRIVLIDFGTAHKIERDAEHVPTWNTMNTYQGNYVIVGTRGYAPPELCFQPCRDIYALGHVIRDCFRANVPIGWSLVINKSISNKREDRYSDISDIRKDIENIDRIGMEEMSRRIYEDRQRSMKLQEEIASGGPVDYTWDRLLKELDKKQEAANAIYAGASQVFVDFRDLAPVQSIRIRRPLTLSGKRYVVIRGPGMVRVNLDALLADDDGDIRPKARGGKPAMVILWNNVTLVNTSEKKLEDGNIVYVVGDSCYLNFPNISANERIDWHFVATSNMGHSFVCYGGPRDMARLIAKMNDRVRKAIPERYMMSAREFFYDGSDKAKPVKDYIEDNKIIAEILGLPRSG